jgi:hypothetical protein
LHPQFTDKARKTCRSTWMRFEECFLRGTIITHALFGDDWGRFVHFRCVWCHFMCSCFLTFWLEYEWLPHPVRTALVPFRTFLRVARALQKHHLIMSAKLGPKTRQARPGLVLQCRLHRNQPGRSAKAIPWWQTTSVRVPSGTQAVQTHGPLHAICITILCTGAPAKLLTELSGCCAHSQAKTGHQLNTTFPPTHPPGWPKTRLKYCFDYALQDFVLLGAKVWPKGE